MFLTCCLSFLLFIAFVIIWMEYKRRKFIRALQEQERTFNAYSEEDAGWDTHTFSSDPDLQYQTPRSPSAVKEMPCPHCSVPMIYSEEYGGWYCDSCDERG